MALGRLRALVFVPVVAVILAGAGGCSSGGGTPAATSPASHTATGAPASDPASSITIRDFGYGAPIAVAPGATVTVTNLDSARHTVTADEGPAFDVDVQGSGGTGTFTAPTQPGTYAYHCTYHPGMHGTLTVK